MWYDLLHFLSEQVKSTLTVVQRAWTVLEEKGIPYIPCQGVEVNPHHKRESRMKLNPRGLDPTLQYNYTVICEFLEDAFPDHGPKLHPSTLMTGPSQGSAR